MSQIERHERRQSTEPRFERRATAPLGVALGALIAASSPLLSGCPAPTKGPPPLNTSNNSVNSVKKAPTGAAKTALPEIPAELTVKTIDPLSGNQPDARSPLLGYMQEENARWMKRLSQQGTSPAYYMAYAIHDQRLVAIEAEGGALVNSDDQHDRYMDVEVRVGSTELDNRRPLSSNDRGLNEALTRQVFAPFGTDKQAIQTAFWMETDRRYREAAQQLYYVKQDRKLTKSKDGAADFVHEPKETFIQPEATLTFDKEKWIARVKACSKKALHGFATRGSCSVLFELNSMYFVNSEGTVLQMSWPQARLVVSVGVKADDGEGLSRLEQRFARTPEGLPSSADVDKMIETATSDLDKLYKAPRVDPYVGPAILEGRAAGVFFHEVFGHRIEGHRQKERSSGRTFASKVGQPIMPSWLSVYDDPTIDVLNGRWLNGFYRFDDEGVRAQRATLVDKGVLKGFDMGRNPIAGFPHSNGHGRKQLGRVTVSRQGNLVVESDRSVTNAELEKMLIAEVKRQKKPFGMIFTDIKGGFTLTTTDLPQSFKVEPVLAYRLYADGHKELVRGVDIVGTPLTALGNIVAAGRSIETFNGMCGAESGWVPVSASAPNLLIKSLEVERKAAPVDRSPIMAPPEIRLTPPELSPRRATNRTTRSGDYQ